MNYTENYQLPQWEKTDRIMMEDFNGAMANIEAGLTENRDSAAKGIAAAQRTADAARAEAAVLPYVVGSYEGSLQETKITLGFRPSAVFISRAYTSNEVEDACAFLTDKVSSAVVTFQDDGFTLHGSAYNYPSVNWDNTYYYYIAFR